MFKPKFVERYGKLIEDLDAFLEISKEPLRDSIRVNTLKMKKKELKERLEERGWKLEEIPWYKYGFFVETEEVMGNSLEHVLGYFYVQEAVSMLPPVALNPKPGEIILDMCACSWEQVHPDSDAYEKRGGLGGQRCETGQDHRLEGKPPKVWSDERGGHQDGRF